MKKKKKKTFLSNTFALACEAGVNISDPVCKSSNNCAKHTTKTFTIITENLCVKENTCYSVLSTSLPLDYLYKPSAEVVLERDFDLTRFDTSYVFSEKGPKTVLLHLVLSLDW